MGQIRNLLGSLSIAHDIAERHRPSGRNAFATRAPQSIDDYLNTCRQNVLAARTDCEAENADWIIDGNSAFVLKPHGETRHKRGILMVHGLTDSPFLVGDMAEFFADKGFYVLAMQLPGHGTRPGDLLDIRWQDWLAAHNRVLELLRAEVEDVHLLGFSLGATLNLYQALRHEDIKSLFLFSPAVRVSRVAQLACPLAYLGRRWQRLAWFNIQPDTDCFKYESLSNRAICEVYKLIAAWNRLQSLKRLDVPLFIAASENDATIDSRALLKWFARQNVSHARMLYYSSDTPAVPDGVKVINARLPGRNIRSFSHTALLHSPDNPHYGADGSLRFCTHYYRLDPEKYRRCKAGDADCLGEMFDESADCRVIQRLTFNPHFEAMLGEIETFLDAIGADTD